jgi:ubiquinone/menaquinone biosynthesis C-methylase UbiE
MGTRTASLLCCGPAMISPFQMLIMILAQQFGRQRLDRRPEPSQTTDAQENVLQYDRVMSTKLAVAYAAGLEILYRARPGGSPGKAIDLACGPGHFTLCLAKHLGYQEVSGIDLSPGMVGVAAKNAAEQGLQSRVTFREGDATCLRDVPDSQYDLASFTDAAHHMPDLDAVTAVLQEMDRITRPDGIVMVMDLVRLRTAKLTERYVRLLGRDYEERGLPNFYRDFENSMYAAWTPSEMASAVPADTRRHWCHIVPRLLPTIQVLLGLPSDRPQAFVRRGLPWAKGQGPVSPENRADLAMLRVTVGLGSHRYVAAQKREPSNSEGSHGNASCCSR